MNILSLILFASFLSCQEEVTIPDKDKEPVEDTKPDNDSDKEDEEDNNEDDNEDEEEKPGMKVTIRPGTKYQEMDGFGASGAWLGEVVGKYWSEPTKSEIAELLFSSEIIDGIPNGIGLSHWRVNLGSGSALEGHDGGIGAERRTETYLNQDGTYTWNGRCEGQKYFMTKAKEYGCNDFTLFSCSAPVYYTKNGYAYSSDSQNANIQDDKYDDFADYMATVAKHYVDQGFNINYISPINEPQNAWNTYAQEGSPWQRHEMARIARELDTKITEKGLQDTKILMAESMYWWYFNGDNGTNRGDLIWHFFDKASESYIGDLDHMPNIFCSHSYGIDTSWDEMYLPRFNAKLTAEAYGIDKLYMTEWCMVDHGKPYEEVKDFNTAKEIDLALAMSKVIHHDLTFANVSAWFYWTALDRQWGNKNRYSLIYITHPSQGDWGNIFENGTYSANKNLWALGNYSLFVRPGYYRVYLQLPEENKKFFATAFLSPDSSDLVVVYTNCTQEEVIVNDVFQGVSGTPVLKAQYVTSDTMNLQQVDDESFRKVPPRSVTTMLYKIQ